MTSINLNDDMDVNKSDASSSDSDDSYDSSSSDEELFSYEEEADSSGFFVPYLWSVLVEVVFPLDIAFDMSNVQIYDVEFAPPPESAGGIGNDVTSRNQNEGDVGQMGITTQVLPGGEDGPPNDDSVV